MVISDLKVPVRLMVNGKEASRTRIKVLGVIAYLLGLKIHIEAE